MKQAAKQEARRFLLRKQGLLGGHLFVGKEGALRYLRQAGCIQFDPIDVCGKNAELVLQARVKGFQKKFLPQLLYEDRALVDYFDKNLSIFPAEDWPCFLRTRERYGHWELGRQEIDAVEPAVFRTLEQQEFVCSKDFSFSQKIDWPWAPAKLSRAALESLYFRGKLAVHHKEGTLKFYTLPERCFPPELWNAPDPFSDNGEYYCWRVKRRVGAVGLLWNRPSDAWLGIDGLNAGLRGRCFFRLEERGELCPVQVDGLKVPLYYLAEDEILWDECAAPQSSRTEFLAPLDGMLWDRNLIRELFGFDYKWEIYTPAAERRYGYYVLPVLSGDRFVGRVEAVRDTGEGVLRVKNFWPETGVRETKALKRAVAARARRFARFNGCGELALPENLTE